LVHGVGLLSVARCIVIVVFAVVVGFCVASFSWVVVVVVGGGVVVIVVEVVVGPQVVSLVGVVIGVVGGVVVVVVAGALLLVVMLDAIAILDATGVLGVVVGVGGGVGGFGNFALALSTSSRMAVGSPARIVRFFQVFLSCASLQTSS
jgi:hypothetical protein